MDGGRLLRIGLEVIDARDAMQHVEPQGRLVAQEQPDLRQRTAGHFDPRIDRGRLRAEDGRTEAAAQLLVKIFELHRAYYLKFSNCI